ncbi:Uncharacterized protein OBRU01_01757, partial [Operophtera brumata]
SITKCEVKNEKEMNESKAVYVTKHKIRDQNLVYQIYAKRNREYTDKSNFGCQYDCKRDKLLCTCRNISLKRPKPQNMEYCRGVPNEIYTYQGSRSFTDVGVGSVKAVQRRKVRRVYLPETDDRGVGNSNLDTFTSRVPNEIYTYQGSRSFTDVGVGSVKAVQRRKVRRVYLPETDDRGVGNSNLDTFTSRKSKQQHGSFYDHKRTSSKCVGGFQEHYTGSVISEKLSPIIHTRSGTTSPKLLTDQRNIEIGSSTVDKNLVTTGTQFEIECTESEKSKEEKAKTERKKRSKVTEQARKHKYSSELHSKMSSVIERKVKQAEKVYSSDSLVQHIHELEIPSDEKQSRPSTDEMENKLEREYRRMFSTKDRDSKLSIDKHIPAFKSASILRRRFEALRRGLVKKDDGKKSVAPSSQDSGISRKDASVTSDPPSLEGRSYTDTKRYSPILSNVSQDRNRINYKTEIDSLQWPQKDSDSEGQGVKGMFKLWGKKFNFEEEAERVRSPPTPLLTIDINKKPHRKESKTNKEEECKKGAKKFCFFKSKTCKHQVNTKIKDIKKEPYKPSGLTAGRCEIRDGLKIKDGLTLKIGTITPKEQASKISEGDEIRRRTWLKKLLANTIESARSVNVRWNNSMYATSSSTVIKLMDTIYTNNGTILKSRSETTNDESLYDRSHTPNTVNFDQKIEAWMIPYTIPDRPREIPIRIQSNTEIKKNETDITISDRRWFIEKSKAFENKIKVFLHSNDLMKNSSKVSSEYLRIDIPKDFFDVSSSHESKQSTTSDEEVYKIVEYESDLDTRTALDKGDHASKIEVLVNLQDSNNIEAKILHRDVLIQGSNVNIPKKCDVISVGIITQRDMRNIRKPILKVQDNLTDDDSEEELQTNQKCEFAESYLREYYRLWTPLDFFSWCVSDSNVRSCSEQSSISVPNQGDGSKSCPNICNDMQSTTSTTQNDNQEPNEPFKTKLYKTLRRLTKAKTDINIAGQRVLPKDSLQVFKRRKIYAAALRSQWNSNDNEISSSASIEAKGPQNTRVPSSKTRIIDVKKKSGNKHVSMCSIKKNATKKYTCLTPSSTENVNTINLPCVQCIPSNNEFPKRSALKHTLPNTPPEHSTPISPMPVCKKCCPPDSLGNSPKRSPKLSQRPSPQSSPKVSQIPSPRRSPKEKTEPSPKISPNESPGPSSQRSPKKTPYWSPCMIHTPISQKKRAPKDTKCHHPPSKQVSNPPSRSNSTTRQQNEENETDSPSRNKKLECPQKPAKQQQQSPIPKKCSDCSNQKNKPDCPKKQQQQSPVPCPVPAKQSSEEINKSNMGLPGLLLKMKPSAKECSGPIEYLSWESPGDKIELVKLNTHDDIKINYKKKTPSTEEITEGMNVKVLDEDGQTLYERKNYTCEQSEHLPSLGDTYRDSNVNRLSTPIILETKEGTKDNPKQREVVHDINDPSLANLIELQFQLRITQGNKTTEINIANEDEDKHDKGNKISKTSPEVFILENGGKEPVEDISPNNDINIKIIVKNYKQNSDKTKNIKKKYDEFTKQISDKFHTVSTGYSDIVTGQNVDNAFSVHRATVGLDYSEDKSKTLSKPSNDGSVALHEPVSFMVSSQTTVHSTTDFNEDENDNNKITSKKRTQSYDKFDDTNTNVLETKDLDIDQNAWLDLKTSKECYGKKLYSKDKKELLKKVIGKAHAKPKNKENVRKLRNILKIILTDSSDDDEMNAASNELAKDVTYTSLKPDYFRNTDSMNNYFKVESSLTIDERKVTSNSPYPTGENSSETSRSSEKVKKGCLCSHIAEKFDHDLKIGCCCRKQTKMDEKTSCDIRNDQDLILVNYRTEYVDVHTQNSKHLSNKTNSINLSIYSRENNSVQNETGRISVKEISTNTASDFKEMLVENRVSLHKNHLNRNTILGISEDDKIVKISEEDARKARARTKQNGKTINNNLKLIKAADVLQSPATKKAVLEIYAEKTTSKSGEYFVVKLPKFVYEKESEITTNYELIATNSYRSSVCRRNMRMFADC